MVKISWKLKL